jgi:hypothetical protein
VCWLHDRVQHVSRHQQAQGERGLLPHR